MINKLTKSTLALIINYQKVRKKMANTINNEIKMRNNLSGKGIVSNL
jgi:hypothetical protein